MSGLKDLHQRQNAVAAARDEIPKAEILQSMLARAFAAFWLPASLLRGSPRAPRVLGMAALNMMTVLHYFSRATICHI